MSVTFIGDVHGWAERLERVLAQCSGNLVFVGDLVDRGPDARAVIDRVRSLCDAGRARCLLGNHEYALVKGLGLPELGITPDPDLYQAWCTIYGGDAVLENFGVHDGDPERLRAALGDRLPWLAGLPWLLEGACDNRAWVAVHAGLTRDPWPAQRERLLAGWQFDEGDELPHWLYDKRSILDLPADFPARTCLVSGHTPQPRPLISPKRILCDTSGGRPGRPLSAVVWPEGKVFVG
jgi:hypothetical protein